MTYRLAITLGDPMGIGPEVVLKALADRQLTDEIEMTVVGSLSILRDTYARLAGGSEPVANPEELSVLDCPLPEEIERQLVLGTGNRASGWASFAYLQAAIAHTQEGKFQGIVTGPIAKSAWKAAGYDYPGQTELLAEASGTEQFGMLFVGRSPHTQWQLITLLATTHISLRKVPKILTTTLLDQKLQLLINVLQTRFGLDRPRIAIAGLNPHSGEEGQLGTEEIDWLIPWIERSRKIYPNLTLDGPIPPDTMWVKPAQAWYDSSFADSACDAYIALYHDQGLIPVKMLAFDRAVNTSIGLPFVRTSPDHGTAFDIAGRGIAQSTSMKAAIQLATELVYQRNVIGRSFSQDFLI
ncbi:4-hydroxythreonine-4-phosphate dehydrogenase PdxA [Roseofilum casamattae]|uniref:4-hydroxythreonine-4-phosphate dehydrogenase n=1 Tax=Roseofilum casamattae BLCC-M143 TaxID=3022442 RepID=A0ABT7BSU0_9CYAN|nr:4-hydroxythreonine-4-phosphate dehydrogenase PdxA [Roseofilum casamattae]MDJ1182246.1 4-hydroxythreonine-4-phosphate dehydrogenase PdxA [Roseofilum casamattae BLCC-M143]